MKSAMKPIRPIIEMIALLLLACLFAILTAASLVLFIRIGGTQAHYKSTVLLSTIPGAIVATGFWYWRHGQKNISEIHWSYQHSVAWGLMGWFASVVFLLLYSFAQPDPFSGGPTTAQSAFGWIYGVAMLGLLFGAPAILLLMPLAMFIGQWLLKKIRAG